MAKRLNAIDLFAGAGGLSLGFEKAGFEVSVALEKDEWAADTYENNRQNVKLIRDDITNLSDSFFRNFKGIDVVMGGPPCQGFSISASNRRDPHDPRNLMYVHFLRFVSATKPRVVLVENVKEILAARLPDKSSLLADFCERLYKLGYHVSHSLLNAADFGVPQNRIRFFLFASLKTSPEISKLHSLKKYGFEDPLFNNSNPYSTLWNAISDLPAVTPRKHSENDVLDYGKGPENDYQALLRENSDRIHNHIPMRHTERIIERFKNIPIGGNQLDVGDKHGCRLRGNPSEKSGKIYYQNHRRLDPNSPSPTITASFYSSFIHPYEHRNLTVREAARIQSFPDSYIFYGKRTTLSKKLLAKKGIYEDIHLDQFNQVGNSVPPILASVLADFIHNSLLN